MSIVKFWIPNRQFSNTVRKNCTISSSKCQISNSNRQISKPIRHNCQILTTNQISIFICQISNVKPSKLSNLEFELSNYPSNCQILFRMCKSFLWTVKLKLFDFTSTNLYELSHFKLHTKSEMARKRDWIASSRYPLNLIQHFPSSSCFSSLKNFREIQSRVDTTRCLIYSSGKPTQDI